MAKLTKINAFKELGAKPESAMDRTTRVVRRIVDEEAEKRQEKTARLRNDRLEREANTPPETKGKAKGRTRSS